MHACTSNHSRIHLHLQRHSRVVFLNSDAPLFLDQGSELRFPLLKAVSELSRFSPHPARIFCRNKSGDLHTEIILFFLPISGRRAEAAGHCKAEFGDQMMIDDVLV